MIIQEKLSSAFAWFTKSGVSEGCRNALLVVVLNVLGVFWPLAGVIVLLSGGLIFRDRSMLAIYGVVLGCAACLLSAV